MTRHRSADRLDVCTPAGTSGLLALEAGNYLFGYDRDAARESEISLLMPRRVEQYTRPDLHPIFQMSLPEGYVLESLRNRFAKRAVFDPMLLLAMTGSDSPIGRVRVQAPPDLFTSLDASRASGGERLDEILAWRGPENLFEELAQRYLLRTGVSGVQPKVLVPEVEPGKASMTTSDLIVKSGGAEFPGLAVNEFVCMSSAQIAGLQVPEFHLSKDRQLFVMRRFDRDGKGVPLGFEEVLVLMGKAAAQKYTGSYESIARFLKLFCSPEYQGPALAQLFDQVALSCMIGNGDAHLKNFGVLYTDPATQDVRMAPAYDLVCTTAYIAGDSLALTLGGSKRLDPPVERLLEFARNCAVLDPKARLRELLAAVERTLTEHQGLLETEPLVQRGLHAAWQSAAGRFG